MKKLNWLEKEIGLKINDINSVVDDRYEDELFDIYEDLRSDYIEDEIDFNIGEIEKRLIASEYYSIIDDLGLSNSDLELGYGSEILSNMVNSGDIYDLTYENDVVWDKYIEGNEFKMANGFIRVVEFETDIEYIVCPICGHVMYLGLDFKCKSCNFEGRNKNKRSKGEIYVSSKLKEYGIEFNEEVIEIDKLRYDFVLLKDGIKYYIEINGLQHYEPIEHFGGEEYFKKVIVNDLKKKKHAEKNGVYVVIDYREHDVKLLKQRFDKFVEKYNILGGK